MLNWLRRGVSLQADLALDLGSWQSRVISPEGLVDSQSSCVLWDLSENRCLWVGDEACQRLGRHPLHWSAIRPFHRGRLRDFDAGERLARLLLSRSPGRGHILCGAPALAGDFELQILAELLREAGAASVCLVPASLCLVGALGREALDSAGVAVVEFGHGLCQASVFTRGRALVHFQEEVGGLDLQRRIGEHFRRRHWLALGREQIRSITERLDCRSLERGHSSSEAVEEDSGWWCLAGQDLQSGLPRTLTVAPWELNFVLRESLRPLIRLLGRLVEDLPPDILHPILQDGVLLAGGLSQLAGLEDFLEAEITMPVRVWSGQSSATVAGMGLFLRHPDLLHGLSSGAAFSAGSR